MRIKVIEFQKILTWKILFKNLKSYVGKISIFETLQFYKILNLEKNSIFNNLKFKNPNP